jgi:hypothetical protein
MTMTTMNEAMASVTDVTFKNESSNKAHTTSNKSVSILDILSIEQRGALAVKYNALAPEIRASLSNTYPSLDSVERYVVRQLVKEANSKLTSSLSPVWRARLVLFIPDLINKNQDTRKNAERQFVNVVEEMPDAKVISTILKWCKNQLDLTTTSVEIVEACKLAGIEPATLK